MSNLKGTLLGLLKTSTGAGLIGYKRPEINAVGRTVESFLLGTATVSDFGVLGDGTDETAKLQAAIDSGKNIDLIGLQINANNLTQNTNFQKIYSSNGIGKIIKNANGDLFTSTANDVFFENINWRGDAGIPVFTGDNLVCTGDRISTINCGSRWAYGRAAKFTGDRTRIIGTSDIWQTADGAGLPATAYDIEIGSATKANLYSNLSDIYTSQHAGGILLHNVGSYTVLGGQFGKLYIKNTSSLAGTNGGKVLGSRILGDILVELPSAIFSGNQFSSITITLTLGTSNCRIDLSNNFETGAIVINNGNVNNLVMREISGGGSSEIKIGDDTKTHITKRDLMAGDTLFPGYIDAPNNRGLRARNAANSGFLNLGYADISDRIHLGDSTSGFTTINSGAGGVYVSIAGITKWQFTPTSLRPQTDNTTSIGTAAQRPSVIYAATGAINTSDRREKQQIGKIPNEWLDAWSDVDFIRYKWNSSVVEKGDKSRYHIGLIAQNIEEVFKSHGLNAFEIGLLCFDTWDVEKEIINDGIISQEIKQSGNLYGIRPDECLFLEAALNRREGARIKQEILKIKKLK